MFKFSPFYFFMALCVGFIFIYSTAPKPKVIIKNPTPENAGKILYRDDDNICYRYHKVSVPCPEYNSNETHNYYNKENKHNNK